MVGVVLVSHSRALALAVQELVRSMTGPALPLAVAAGVGEGRKELGTDAVEISEAILAVKGKEGVLVLMDMGSAILSAETALDLLDDDQKANVQFCAAPFVEGAVAAGVTANLGAPLTEVCREALASLQQKQGSLNASKTDAVPTSVNMGKQDASWKTIRLVVRNPHGLHARPAAKLIQETRPFHSEITVRNLSNERGPVSIKSLSSLASLEILQDNEIEVGASGGDAISALEKIGQLVEGGLGDQLPTRKNEAINGDGVKAVLPKNIPTGPVPVSGGIAIGPMIHGQEALIEIPQGKIEDTAAEIERLQRAVTAVEKLMAERQAQMSRSVGAGHAGIYEAQIMALQDPELTGSAKRLIEAEKVNAALAWDRANSEIVKRYEALQDAYLRERAVDLKDVGRQVLEQLVDQKAKALTFSEPSILVAEDLTPGQISTLDRKWVRGVILLGGGPTAHSSILLRALGVPTIVQARSVLSEADFGRIKLIAFDGATGQVWLNPEAKLVSDLQVQRANEAAQAAEEKEASSQPGATLDGERVEIFANLGQAAGTEMALEYGAEGVGLLRTEFLFLERQSAPTEDDQVAALREVADRMGDKPVIVRTLDAGGDKELPYLPMAKEENPFLGVRAIRLCFANKELFTTHLRAILRAGHERNFRIMFPMIATVTDLNLARAWLENVHRSLEKENIPHLWPVETGIMIEIPSAALQVELLAEKVDFFSIGTNDLTQYTLAVDRGNPGLAQYQDALHPSVLRLIEMVVAGARKHNRLVAVCGEAASDEAAAAIFVGLGVRELSMTGTKIPQLKAMLRKRKVCELQQLAQRALQCQTAEEVRALR